MKSYVTRSDYYMTHLGVHIGFIQYDGFEQNIKLCMLRIDLSIPKTVRELLVGISRSYRTKVVEKMIEVLERYGIKYEVCLRIITQADLEYLTVGKKVPAVVKRAAKAYKIYGKKDLTDEDFMKKLTRESFMDNIYLYYLSN